MKEGLLGIMAPAGDSQELTREEFLEGVKRLTDREKDLPDYVICYKGMMYMGKVGEVMTAVLAEMQKDSGVDMQAELIKIKENLAIREQTPFPVILPLTLREYKTGRERRRERRKRERLNKRR